MYARVFRVDWGFQSISGLSGHEVCTHTSCGREPALPEFGTDAPPEKCVCVVSCFGFREKSSYGEIICVRGTCPCVLFLPKVRMFW